MVSAHVSIAVLPSNFPETIVTERVLLEQATSTVTVSNKLFIVYISLGSQLLLVVGSFIPAVELLTILGIKLGDFRNHHLSPYALSITQKANSVKNGIGQWYYEYRFSMRCINWFKLMPQANRLAHPA